MVNAKGRNNLIVWLLLSFFVILMLGILGMLNKHELNEKNKSSPTPFSRKIILGAWTEGLFDAPTQKLQPEKLLEFEDLIDKKVSIAHYYIGWESLTSNDFLSQLEVLRANNWHPMVNVNPYYFKECQALKIPLYRAIADGNCDNFIRRAARNLTSAKEPFYMVFAWEMNNWQNEWSISKTGSTNEDFVAAWRHMHDIFGEENVKNVIWVFCPNVPEEENFPYNKIYPGSEYTDWIALDGYNWGDTQSWSKWTTFEGVFSGAYKSIVSTAPDKPLMIAEFNTTDKGGDKAGWYIDALTQQIPLHFPKIEAVVIFNEDKTNNEGVNWRVDVNKESLEGFKKAVDNEIY